MKVRLTQPVAGNGWQIAAKAEIDTEANEFALSADDWQRLVERGVAVEIEPAKPARRRRKAAE